MVQVGCLVAASRSISTTALHVYAHEYKRMRFVMPTNGISVPVTRKRMRLVGMQLEGVVNQFKRMREVLARSLQLIRRLE